MLTTFRKFQKGALIVVTIIIVIAFAFLYSDFDFAKGTLGSSDCVIKVHNRCYRVEEAQKMARFQSLAMNLGMGEFAQTLTGPSRLDRDPTNFVMNMLVLRKEAESLGVEPSAQEIKEAVPNLPFVQQFQLNGDRMRNLLGQFGLDEGDLAQLVKDYLSFNKIQDLVGSGIQAVPTQVEKSYIQRNQRYSASVINFDESDFEKKAVVSDEDIKRFFDERNQTKTESVIPEKTLEFAEDPSATEPASPEKKFPPIMTAPMRGFDYVKFVPEKLAEDATQEDRSKNDINFAKQVNKIYSELAEKSEDFVKIATDYAAKESPFKMEVGKFEPFEATKAPETIKNDPKLLTNLFSETLAKDEIGVPQPGEEGSYFIFKYSSLVEPRQMTLEEAKPMIVKELKAKKLNQLTNDAANEGLAKLQKALDEGKSILDAASANNYNLVTLPNFSAAERPESAEDSDTILGSVQEIGPGQLSKVFRRKNGGYFVTYVDKIEIYKDENKDLQLRTLVANIEREEKTLLFQGWLNQRARESGAARNDSILNYPSR